MALTGQQSTQARHSVQSALIAYLSPAAAMALTGQESTQVPQAIQSSVIFRVMMLSLCGMIEMKTG
jgi:hypothetical protein